MTDLPADPNDERGHRDARDERLAARLETAPLDEVTRTRLVRAAMTASEPATTVAASSGPPRSRSRLRWLSAAAAIVVVLAVGAAVVIGGGSDSNPTASRAPRPSASTNLESKAADGLNRTFSANTAALGDLGDVSTRAMLRRAVTAAEAAPASRSTVTDEAAGAMTVLPRTDTTSCVPTLPGEIVAVGTGTDHGEPVSVYVVKRKGGSRSAVVVRADCDVGEPVPL